MHTRSAWVYGARGWAMAPAFALWSNLHGGFPYGLVVLGLGAVQPLLPPRWGGEGRLARAPWISLAAAVAGSLANPHPVALYRLVFEVARDLEMISHHITEWAPMPLTDPPRIPYWTLALAATLVPLWRLRTARALPLAPVAWSLYLCLQAARHARFGVYFSLFTVPLVASLVADLFEGDAPPAARRLRDAALVGAVALCLAAGVVWESGRRLFHTERYPTRAAAFLEAERATLEGARLYHPWHWGGYLGWRLWPAWRVLCDGRYLFHAMLPEMDAAGRSPARWQHLLDRYRVRVAILPALPTTFRVPWRAPDGRVALVELPYDAIFMDPARWALVAWDEVARVYVRRAEAPAAWLDANEYRHLRPGVPPELTNAVPARLAAERARHDRALSLPAALR